MIALARQSEGLPELRDGVDVTRAALLEKIGSIARFTSTASKPSMINATAAKLTSRVEQKRGHPFGDDGSVRASMDLRDAIQDRLARMHDKVQICTGHMTRTDWGAGTLHSVQQHIAHQVGVGVTQLARTADRIDRRAACDNLIVRLTRSMIVGRLALSSKRQMVAERIDAMAAKRHASSTRMVAIRAIVLRRLEDRVAPLDPQSAHARRAIARLYMAHGQIKKSNRGFIAMRATRGHVPMPPREPGPERKDLSSVTPTQGHDASSEQPLVHDAKSDSDREAVRFATIDYEQKLRAAAWSRLRNSGMPVLLDQGRYDMDMNELPAAERAALCHPDFATELQHRLQILFKQQADQDAKSSSSTQSAAQELVKLSAQRDWLNRGLRGR